MKKLFTSGVIAAFAVSLIAQQHLPVQFLHEGKTVYGTLTVPAGPGPFTTIVMNPGTGVSERDLTIVLQGDNAVCLYPDLLGDTLRPFRDVATALADSGFAVLRYDKLEYTYPNPIALLPLTFRKLWLPVHSAVAFLKTHPAVDPDNIVLLGHSEGSWLVPYIARERGDVRALISVAGSRTSFDSLLAWQVVHITELCNGDVALAQLQAAQILAYYHLIRTQQWTGNTPALFGVPPAVWFDYLTVTDAVVEHYNEAGLPTLFLGMGEDINVPPSELERFRQEVTITDDFWLMEGLNHFLTPMDDHRVPEALTDTIVHWLRQLGPVSRVGDPPVDAPGLAVWPVPFRDVFHVRLTGMDPGMARFRLLDMLGRVVEQWEVWIDETGPATTLAPSVELSGVMILEVNAHRNGVPCLETIRVIAE